jgi:hypothetical protein
VPHEESDGEERSLRPVVSSPVPQTHPRSSISGASWAPAESKHRTVMRKGRGEDRVGGEEFCSCSIDRGADQCCHPFDFAQGRLSAAVGMTECEMGVL